MISLLSISLYTLGLNWWFLYKIRSIKHTLNITTQICYGLYMDIHTYIYKYPWSTHSHAHMYSPAPIYIYSHLLMCLHIYIELSLYTTVPASMVSHMPKSWACGNLFLSGVRYSDLMEILISTFACHISMLQGSSTSSVDRLSQVQPPSKSKIIQLGRKLLGTIRDTKINKAYWDLSSFSNTFFFIKFLHTIVCLPSLLTITSGKVINKKLRLAQGHKHGTRSEDRIYHSVVIGRWE